MMIPMVPLFLQSLLRLLTLEDDSGLAANSIKKVRFLAKAVSFIKRCLIL